MAAHLDISSREKEGVKILDLSGKLAVGGASDLREKVSAETAAGSLRQLLNLKDVEYIDSTGLGTLVICFTALQKAGGNPEILQLNRRNMELLLFTKLSTVFQIFGEEQDGSMASPGSRDQAFRHSQLRSAAQGRRRINPQACSAVARKCWWKRAPRRLPSSSSAWTNPRDRSPISWNVDPRFWLFTKSVARSASSPLLT